MVCLTAGVVYLVGCLVRMLQASYIQFSAGWVVNILGGTGDSTEAERQTQLHCRGEVPDDALSLGYSH